MLVKPATVTVVNKIKKVLKNSDGPMMVTKMSRLLRTSLEDRGQISCSGQDGSICMELALVLETMKRIDKILKLCFYRLVIWQQRTVIPNKCKCSSINQTTINRITTKVKLVKKSISGKYFVK